MERLFFELWATDRFLDQLTGLGSDAQRQVVKKTWEVLPYDPRDNGDSKKFLQGSRRRVKAYRLRSGKYRVIYTYDPRQKWVTLHGVDDRGDLEHEYVNQIEAVNAGRGEHLAPLLPGQRRPEQGADQPLEPRLDFPKLGARAAASRGLPRAIDDALLDAVFIPPQYRADLRRCKTEEALLAAPLPPDLHDALIAAVFADDPVIMPNQRRWHLRDEESLLKWLRGDLTTLLLDLDPEQERHIAWSASNRGPTLLKGGPGSGKSVVAAYRAQNLVLALRKEGNPEPRVLLTTFTNALANTLRRLTDRLLGPDAACVDVITSDQLVKRILIEAGYRYQPKDDGVARAACHFALERLSCGNESDRSHRARLQKYGLDYLREEVERVIVGRNLTSLDAYRQASRAGRKVGFTGPIREAVWRLAEEMAQYHDQRRQMTFAQTRREALRVLLDERVDLRYDGVVIDEAQDLDPNLLQIAVTLCPSPGRLFVTADSDQSIYGGSFRWSEASKALNFQGRTGRLENCYRSTAEIASAARDWLAGAGIEPPEPVSFPRRGARPIVHAVADRAAGHEAVEQFLRGVMADLLVGGSSCAVLVPTNDEGRAVAAFLCRQGLPAGHQESASFDIEAPGIKVATFHAAKGLEFPAVAVLDREIAPIPANDAEEARQERQEDAERERRVRYVAMTRSIHALAYIRISGTGVPDKAFSDELWRSADQGWGGWLECEVAAGD